MNSVVEFVVESLTETDEYWREMVLFGSEGKVIAGYAQTQAVPGQCTPGWFSGKSTLILGAEARPGGSPPTATQVEWRIAVALTAIKEHDTDFLIVAAKRTFGGLHSGVYGAKVDVFLNGLTKEDSKLKIIPPQHSDYFYRPNMPEGMPCIPPLDRCNTIYAWPLDEGDLSLTAPKQVVCVRIGPEATWDVDYVGIVLNVRKRRVRRPLWRVLELVAAAILGALAVRFFG